MLSWGFDDIWGYLDKKILGMGGSCWLGSARAGHCLCRGGAWALLQTQHRMIWGWGKWLCREGNSTRGRLQEFSSWK